MEFRTVSQSSSTSAARSHCTPFVLPANGVFTIDASTITLVTPAIFTPHCSKPTGAALSVADSTDGIALTERDPFYASTIPVVYALAATTVVAYMLVIMLFIAPRSFVSGGVVVLGRRSFTNGPSGGEVGIGVGGRPWLQKVAALTVAISLTIATVTTFNVARDQYEEGFANATVLLDTVINGQELAIMRIISETFLWLAQAQTLIRLFPRQREKIIIKWTALSLISLNLLFSILNQFVYEGSTRPNAFKDAVPALSYLFHLSLGLLYCAWVIYYSILKKRYAFYHPQMWNICLLALIALIAVLVPVVFFVLDIARPDVAQWGDYVRWVGAAAASVVVWEWVERIEALERNDKKDGVLGREVFDGDEMLEVTPSMNQPWNRRRPGDHGGDDDTGGAITTASRSWPAMGGIANRVRPRVAENNQGGKLRPQPVGQHHSRLHQVAVLELPSWPSRPVPAITPVSRTDTGSAESTVYAVRYHPIEEAGQSLSGHQPSDPPTRGSIDIEAQPGPSLSSNELENSGTPETTSAIASSAPVRHYGKARIAVQAMNPFRKQRKSPPAVVSAYIPKAKEPPFGESQSSRWDVLGRLEDFAATHADRLRDKNRTTDAQVAALPVTRIPAPPRRQGLRELSDALDREAQPQSPVTVRQPATTESASITIQSGDGTRRSSGLPASHDNAVASDAAQSVGPRGSLSFVPAVQIEWEEREHEALGTKRPDVSQRSGTALQGSQAGSIPGSIPNSASSRTRSTEVGNLPVVRIPAPSNPRRIESDSASRSTSPAVRSVEAGNLPVVRIPAPSNPRRAESESTSSNTSAPVRSPEAANLPVLRIPAPLNPQRVMEE